MASLEANLVDARSAVANLMTAAERCKATWAQPRAPGKWSPSQITEHVARALDESANVASGSRSKFPTLPFFLRPLIRALLFNRVLKNNAFPKARTNKGLDPESGPLNPAEAKHRLDAAFARFEQACRANAKAGGRVNSATFGKVSVDDYAKFQAIHVRHHTQQMPV